MDIKTIQKLLTESIQYASDNSIAESDNTTYRTSVVNLKNLDSHIQHVLPVEYNQINVYYTTLLEFLMSVEMKKQTSSTDRWAYKVMTTNTYNHHLSQNHFIALKSYQPYNANLFVVYFKRPKANILQSLSDNIMAFYQEKYLDKREAYDTRKRIRDKVNVMIQAAFPNLDISVQLIRLSHVELVFADSLVDLAIIPSRFYKPERTEFEKHTLPYKALNNFEYIGQCLKDMGMTDISTITQQNKSDNRTFVDPESGQKCIIGVERYMIFEREELFEAYLKLDSRIRPLAIAILYIVQSHDIQAIGRHHYLSSYSYMVMIIFYLLNALEEPLIPNLQNLPKNKCEINSCFYNAYKGFISTKHSGKIRDVKVRYHTCVYIRHENDKTEIEGKTIWNSHNKTDVGTLLIDFLNYYSLKENFCSCISILHVGKRGTKDRNFPVTVRDPFLQLHNMACGCNDTTMKEIMQVFGNVANFLTQGKTLDEICQNPIAGCTCSICL